MCNIDGKAPVDYLAFLMTRAVARRKEDAARKPAVHDPNLDLHSDPKRPAKELRSYATLAYAISSQGRRFAGYSGASGGMSRQADDESKKNIFMETAQAERRTDRLSTVDAGGKFDPKKQGVPIHSGSQRPYCRCAEPAAASIAISKGETIDNLYFAAFKTPEFNDTRPDCLFSPCPNCTVFLNKYSAGYFIARTEFDETLRLAEKYKRTPKMPLDRKNSNLWIMNPGRAFKETQFNLNGRLYALRCFRCSAV